MADQTIKGANSMFSLYTDIKDEGGQVIAEDYFPVGCITSDSISHSNAMVDGIVTKCNQNPESEYGAESYTITVDALDMEPDGLKASYDAVYAARKKSITDKGYVYWKNVTTHAAGVLPATTTVFGKGRIPELSKESPADGAQTFTFTLNGAGDLSATDLNV